MIDLASVIAFVVMISKVSISLSISSRFSLNSIICYNILSKFFVNPVFLAIKSLLISTFFEEMYSLFFFSSISNFLFLLIIYSFSSFIEFIRNIIKFITILFSFISLFTILEYMIFFNFFSRNEMLTIKT